MAEMVIPPPHLPTPPPPSSLLPPLAVCLVISCMLAPQKALRRERVSTAAGGVLK